MRPRLSALLLPSGFAALTTTLASVPDSSPRPPPTLFVGDVYRNSHSEEGGAQWISLSRSPCRCSPVCSLFVELRHSRPPPASLLYLLPNTPSSFPVPPHVFLLTHRCRGVDLILMSQVTRGFYRGGGGAVDQPQSLSLSLLACLFTLYGGEAFTAAPCLSPLPRHSLTWPWSWRRRSLPLFTVKGCLFRTVNTLKAILVCC